MEHKTIPNTDVLDVSSELIEKNRDAYLALANEGEKLHIIGMIWDDYDEPTRPGDQQYTNEEFRRMKWFMNSAMVVKKYRKQYPKATFSDCLRATGLDVHQVAWNWPKTYEFYLSVDVDGMARKDSSFSERLETIQNRFMDKDYGDVDDDQIMANLTAFSHLRGKIYSCYPSKWGDICIVGILVDGEPVVNAQIMFLSEHKQED